MVKCSFSESELISKGKRTVGRPRTKWFRDVVEGKMKGRNGKEIENNMGRYNVVRH